MAFDEAAVQNLFDLVQSKASGSGYFSAVNTVEPKSSLADGLVCAIWIQDIRPIRASGLNSTTALVTFNARIYQNMLSDPQDAIDPDVLKATTTLIGLYSNDFELIDPQTHLPTVREIDLLGAFSSGLMATAGYLNVAGQMNRVMTISIPVVVNDCWTQSP